MLEACFCAWLRFTNPPRVQIAATKPTIFAAMPVLCGAALNGRGVTIQDPTKFWPLAWQNLGGVDISYDVAGRSGRSLELFYFFYRFKIG
jgi:hypothetical protein